MDASRDINQVMFKDVNTGSQEADPISSMELTPTNSPHRNIKKMGFIK